MLTKEQQHFLDHHIKPLAIEIKRSKAVEMIENSGYIEGFVDRLSIKEHKD